MDRLDAFMEEFWTGTSQYPWSARTQLYGPGHVMLEVNKFAGTIRLNSIQSTYEPGKGHATEAVKWLKGLADKHGVTITGTVKAFGPKENRPTTKRLLDWYVKLGFRKVRGSATEGYDIEYQGKEV